VLTSDGEFHSFRRQSARWAEAGEATLSVVPTEPFGDFAERFLAAANAGEHDLIYVSHVFFRTARVFDRVFELARFARPENPNGGPWVVVDLYHSFMAIPTDLRQVADRMFFVGGGYKYAMAGGGCAFLHAPPGFAARPVATGWFAEFGDLSGKQSGVAFAADATRFLGATFDPTALYRLNAVFDILQREGLDTAAVSAHVLSLRDALADAVARGRCGALSEAKLLTPLDQGARFLAYRHRDAPHWWKALDDAGVVTDYRDDVLRIGLGLYHDRDDVERFCAIAARVLA
jgi:selenocysteine lyase/cysteine desulfurase